MLVRLLTFFLCFSFTFSILAQETVISGVITDEENGETLFGASVAVPALGLGTISNEYGFYSLNIPTGDSITILVSYVGFQNQELRILPSNEQTLNFDLISGLTLNEVVVKANSFREQLNSSEMSVEAITTKEAKVIPVIFGETDIIKTIQLKPGIASGSEGSTGLFVRGGGNDQNLIVLDEAIVYNPNHLFGFFSTFNADAIKDVKIYKGGFPSQYGGRLSSVIDVKLKEGNNKKFAGSGGIGLIASRLTIEGPIQKGKTSFIVSGRRTYADIITRSINKSNEGKKDYNPIPDYYFYDLNTKVNSILSEKDHLYLSGYFGQDVFGFNSDDFVFSFNWGNATGTARWNHTFSSKMFANTTFTYSNYEYKINNELSGFSFDLKSNIKDSNLKSDFYYALNNDHSIRFGGNVTYHQFTVGRLKFASDDGEVSFGAGQEFDGIEFGIYGQDEWNISDRLRINGGIRLSGFTNEGNVDFGV